MLHAGRSTRVAPRGLLHAGRSTGGRSTRVAPRGSLHAGRSTRAAPRGPLHESRSTRGSQIFFYTDVRSILMVLLAFKGQALMAQSSTTSNHNHITYGVDGLAPIYVDGIMVKTSKAIPIVCGPLFLFARRCQTFLRLCRSCKQLLPSSKRKGASRALTVTYCSASLPLYGSAHHHRCSVVKCSAV